MDTSIEHAPNRPGGGTRAEPRFFVAPALLTQSPVQLPAEVAHQVARVLRMRPGEALVLLDGTGTEARARLLAVDNRSTLAEVFSVGQGRSEAGVELILYMSLLNKPDKFELVLQKCTELGAAEFCPVIAERSVPAKADSTRRERWERIIREAAEQSGRSKLPRLREPLTLEEAVSGLGEAGPRHVPLTTIALMPTVGAAGNMAGALRGGKAKRVALLIGPEGGFSGAEVAYAEERGVHLIGLGPRILRAETAAIASAAIVMHEAGELGSPTNSSGPLLQSQTGTGELAG